MIFDSEPAKVERSTPSSVADDCAALPFDVEPVAWVWAVWPSAEAPTLLLLSWIRILNFYPGAWAPCLYTLSMRVAEPRIGETSGFSSLATTISVIDRPVFNKKSSEISSGGEVPPTAPPQGQASDKGP